MFQGTKRTIVILIFTSALKKIALVLNFLKKLFNKELETIINIYNRNAQELSYVFWNSQKVLAIEATVIGSIVDIFQI